MMKCTCIGDIEKKLADKLSADLSVPAKVECQNTAFLFGTAKVELAHTTQFKITAQAKGYVKGKTMPVTANYCPFCGKSVKEDEADGQG